jgi:N-acetylglutamate synthase-like GNAT family acetyltransferase
MTDRKQLPAGGYLLERARAEDAAEIKALVRGEHLNPLGLDWRRFTVARMPAQEKLSGCVQVKPHADGSRELASLVVAVEWRGLGIGAQLVRHCQASAEKRLYLTCRGGLGSYYARFGFTVVSPAAMPPYFKRISRLAKVFGVLFPDGERLLVMCWQPD